MKNVNKNIKKYTRKYRKRYNKKKNIRKSKRKYTRKNTKNKIYLLKGGDGVADTLLKESVDKNIDETLKFTDLSSLRSPKDDGFNGPMTSLAGPVKAITGIMKPFLKNSAIMAAKFTPQYLAAASMEGAMNAGVGIIEKNKDKLKVLTSSFNDLNESANSVVGNATAAVNNAKNAATSAANNVTNSANNAVNNTKNAANNLASSGKAAATNAINDSAKNVTKSLQITGGTRRRK